MAYCSNCGKSLDNMTGAVCPHCGAQFASNPNWQNQNRKQNQVYQDNSNQQNQAFGYYGSGYHSRNEADRRPAAGTNGMCIAGFVCSFFIPILGLIFSIIGLVQVNRDGGGGKGFAIAGIIISVVSWIAAFIILMSGVDFYP